MSKPFQFKLEKILDYRGQLEDQAKAALAQALAAHDAQLEIVTQLTKRFEQHMQKQAASSQSPNHMWLWRQYKDALELDIHSARIQLDKLELNLQQCRHEAVEKSKERKLLEKLKETQAQKYYEEENAREEKENDEIATIRYKSQDF